MRDRFDIVVLVGWWTAGVTVGCWVAAAGAGVVMMRRVARMIDARRDR